MDAWRQFELDLGALAERRERAAEVFDRLTPLLLDSEETSTAWFVRKPPGIRLRVVELQVEPIAAALQDLADDGALAGLSRAVYEPETRRFGGTEAMTAVHDFFAVDTRAFLATRRLGQHGGVSVSPEVFSLTTVGELFRVGLVGAGGEIWDAWCNLAEMHGHPWRERAAEPLPLPTFAQLQELATMAVAPSVAALGSGVHALARHLTRLLHSGALGVGLRGLLATVALFHWNRHGLPKGARHQLLAGALAATDPYRRLPAP